VTVGTINNALTDGSRAYTLTIGGASGTGSILDDETPSPAFTATMTALSNALGTVTTLAYINPGSGGGGAYADLVIAIAAAKAGQTFAAQGTPITMSAVPNRTTGVAPLGVHIDCSGTTASGISSNPFHDLYYVTYFDDDNTATWSYGTQAGVAKKNIAIGPIAAHCFETGGVTRTTKTTAFHLSSDGSTLSIGATVTNTITVGDPDTVYSGTNTICISTSGTFTGKPTGAQEVTTSSWATVVGYMTTGKRVLLRRGESWSTPAGTDTATPTNSSGGTLGSFGTGAAPKVTITTGDTWAIRMASGFTDWRFMDIECDGQSLGASGASGTKFIAHTGAVGSSTGTFCTMLRLYGHHLGSMGAPQDDSMMVDCRYGPTTGGAGNVGVYVEQCSNVAILGSDISDATVSEHCVRLQGVKKTVVSHCKMSDPKTAGDKQAFTLRGWSVGGVWTGDYTEQVVVSDNEITGNTDGYLVEFGPQNSSSDERFRNIIFERNYVQATGLSGSYSNGLVSQVEHSYSIRNNIFKLLGDTQAGIIVYSGTLAPAPTDHWIYGNTFYKPDATVASVFSAIEVRWTGTDAPTGTTAYNNLMYAPAVSSAAFITLGSGTSATYTNNSSNAQAKITSPGFTATPPSTYAEYKPSTYPVDGGVFVNVFDDFFGVARTGTFDIGAVLP